MAYEIEKRTKYIKDSDKWKFWKKDRILDD